MVHMNSKRILVTQTLLQHKIAQLNLNLTIANTSGANAHKLDTDELKNIETEMFN